MTAQTSHHTGQIPWPNVVRFHREVTRRAEAAWGGGGDGHFAL
jgi:hypothetical protein